MDEDKKKEYKIQVLTTWKEKLEEENQSIDKKIDELEKEILEIEAKYDVYLFVKDKNKDIEEINKYFEEYEEKRKNAYKTFEDKKNRIIRNKGINEKYIEQINIFLKQS